MNIQNILDTLGIKAKNSGTWSGISGWSKRTDAGLIDSYNPATGELIASVYSATPEDYQDVIASSFEAYQHWRKTPAPVRGEAIRLCGNALRKYKDELGSLVALEMGKIKQEGDGEVQEMIDIADFAVGQSRMLYGYTMHSERPDHRMYEQWHPLGIVGIISAFNFPVAVWAWNSFLAAICGNISVWKPSPKTPLTSIAVQNICNEALKDAGFPAIFQLFNDGSNELAQQFIEDKRVNLVSFTGSCAVGKQVAVHVQQRMGKVLLELGGNNAIIVDEYANLDLAVPAIVFGAVGTAGQRCTSTRRVFIHDKHFDSLKQKLVNAYQQVRIGDPLEDGTLMGPLIDEASVKRFEASVEAVQAAGGEILTGGSRIEGDGHFVQPTIATAENDWDIVQHETFAPILYLIPFSHLDDAIAMQNNVVQGLSSAIFTDKMQHAEQFLSSIGSDCGIANVNIGTSGAEIGGAFGGEKETGGGRESGSDAWKAYMRRQTNTLNWSNELPLAQGITFDLG
ncbi:MAG: aldehyde dehydrogenase family protein [Gammaproteobacteria bacterium]|nr:aldehyde dehydrogenase family protein [Gammaproteobacteria bacterium]